MIDGVFCLSRLRFDLGHGTNNEAEFEALLKALEDLASACKVAKWNRKLVEVDVFTDSIIVHGWLENFDRKSQSTKNTGNERTRAMKALAGRCIDYLDSFKSFKVQWNPRQRNVETFGH